MGISPHGGLIETSSKGKLDITGSVDAAATHGDSGTWLLDPADLEIINTFDQNINNYGIASAPDYRPDGIETTSYLTVNTITTALNAGNNVIVQTGADSDGNNGDIIVSSAITSSGNGSLTLSAYHNILVNAGIDLAGGNLTLRSDR